MFLPESQRFYLESALPRLYRQRFSRHILDRRNAVWRILCQNWLGRYIPRDASVLEVGAGYCEFINNIEADQRVAVDLNPHTRIHAGAGVSVHEIGADRLMERIPAGSFDVVFMSNFLEHCQSRDQVLAVLGNVALALRPGGRVLILGPNFRYCYKRYFDFFDHHLPLSEHAVVEAIRLAGFEPEEVRPRTLPYSFSCGLPAWPWLVRWYLRIPWVWPLFGAQFFVVGRKREADAGSALSFQRAA